MSLLITCFGLFLAFQLGNAFVLPKERTDLLSEIIRKQIKRDVTVIQRGVGEPCPVLLEDNRNYGANVGWGPSIFGNFYGGGNSYNPNKGGYKSWGGNVGSNGMGIRRGLGVGVPVGARVLGPKQGNNCQDPPLQQQQQFQEVQSRNQAGTFHDSAVVNGGGVAPVAAPPPQSQITVIQTAPGSNWNAMPAQPQTFYNPAPQVFQNFRPING